MNRTDAGLMLLTIGYEGATADEVFAALAQAGVRTLIDVRYRPSSRKPGLSKAGLAEQCEQRGIAYVHERELGTPPEMLDHVQSGAGYDRETTEQYRAFLMTKTDALAAASEYVRTGRACLLCYEADATNCHRSVVAEELARLTGSAVRHL